MTKLPAKRTQIQRFIKYLDKRDEQRRHPYLPIKLMEWHDPKDDTLLAHPAENIIYEVKRGIGKYSCYWVCAVLQKDADPIVLGDEFLCKEEAVEICEAWEYQRVKELGTKQIT